MINFDDDNDGQLEWATKQTYGSTLRVYTGASLTKPDMPKDYTICVAYLVKAFDFRTSVSLFNLNNEDGDDVIRFFLSSQETFTQFSISIYSLYLGLKTDHVLFPFTWTRVCLSVDTVTENIRLVVDGEVIEDKIYKGLLGEDEKRPANLSMILGRPWRSTPPSEYPGTISQLNIFSSSLSTARMVALTEAHGEECGAPGDYVNWEEEEDWKLTSKARIEMVKESEGPCKGQSEVTVYTADFQYHNIGTNIGKHSAVPTEAELSGCMEHCEKVGKGRSPPVRTQEEWDYMFKEVNAITSQDVSVMKEYIWLAATDEEVEGEWRDAYPPHDLLNTSWAWPWLMEEKDSWNGNASNCLQWFTQRQMNRWMEFKCSGTTIFQACLKDVS